MQANLVMTKDPVVCHPDQAVAEVMNILSDRSFRVLRRHYGEILDHKIGDVMDRDPTVVHENESLPSVRAALITYDRFEYAFVADKNNVLQGIIAVLCSKITQIKKRLFFLFDNLC